MSPSEYPLPALFPEMIAVSTDPNLSIVNANVLVPTPKTGVNDNTALPGSVACPDKVMMLLLASTEPMVVPALKIASPDVTVIISPADSPTVEVNCTFRASTDVNVRVAAPAVAGA